MEKDLILQELNQAQKRAVVAPSRPLLIIAGAGTGKTKTLTSRVVHLIENGVPPEEICAVTFTNKAAKEMEERIWQKLNETRQMPEQKQFLSHSPSTSKQSPFMGTFHALCAWILRREAPLVGRTRGFTIFDARDSFQVVKRLVKESLGYKEREEKNGTTPALIAEHISEIKNGKMDPAEGEARHGRPVSPSQVFSEKTWEGKSKTERYQALYRFYEHYEEKMEAQNAFDFDDLIEKVVRIFETHPEVLKKYQRRFTHILVDEYQDIGPMQYRLVRLLAGTSGRFTAVGDDHQMIYTWRYASLKTFLDFEHDWPNAQVMLLEENYRSTKKIIEAASALIANNVGQREKRLWTNNAEGEHIVVRETRDEDDEAEWIAGEIEKFKIKNKKSPGTTAILYRVNAQSRAIEQALLRRQIPYRIVGGVKFYERKEIKDIVAALRYAVNQKDEVSVERLEDALTKRGAAQAMEFLEKPEAVIPAELITLFLKSTDYLERLDRMTKNPRERRENIRELVHFAERFNDLETFLQEITLVQANDMPKGVVGTESDAWVVHLSTIHLAKGLEFDRVYIIGANEGLLPHSLSFGTDREMEEERRLMYVAMTRAKHNLAISFYNIPSRFLGELPKARIALEGRMGKKLSFDDLDDEERYITFD